MANRISLNATSYHGAGAISEVVTEINNNGFKKAFVASDPDLIKFGVQERLQIFLMQQRFLMKSTLTSSQTQQSKT